MPFCFSFTSMQTLNKFYQIEVAWQPKYLILYTAPCLSSGLYLSLTLVRSRRKVVIGLCATRIL